MNKVFSIIPALFYGGLLLIAVPAIIYTQQTSGENKIQNGNQMIAADRAVTVTINATGDGIQVRGWERDEVQVGSSGQRLLELRRIDQNEANKPADGIEVITGKGWGEIVLNVPREATVKIKLAEGNVSVEDVAAADVTAEFGNVNLCRITKSVTANTPMLGDITVKDSSGMINLRALSGTIKLSNVRPAAQNDGIKLNATSGNFVLEGLSHTRIEAETVSGSIVLNGPTAKGTNCSLKTVTGNVTLRLSPDAAFQVVVILGEGGRFFTEFATEVMKKTVYPGSKRFAGKYGAGDSTFHLASFSGRVNLWVKDEENKK